MALWNGPGLIGGTLSGNLSFSNTDNGIILSGGGKLADQAARTVLKANQDAFEVTTENESNNIFQVNFTDSAPLFKGNTVWHAGNDGSGSGLDADTVDGVGVTGSATQGLRKITLSTSDPSGGSDGDIWIKYVP